MERGGVTRGRQWLDFARHRNSLEVWAGETYLALTLYHPRTAGALATAVGWLVLDAAELVTLTDFL